MNKFKSPMVKALRKVGYSTKEAMNIALDIEYNTANQRNISAKQRNHLFHRRTIGIMFVWEETEEGFDFWYEVCRKLAK